MKIKNIVFDFGGVIIDLNRDRAVEKFKELGLGNADDLLGKYRQKGIFEQAEAGQLDAGAFCEALRRLTGRNTPNEEIAKAWLSIVDALPLERLAYIEQLRSTYRVFLLTNNNPFVMDWARSSTFTPTGKTIDDYMDKIYSSNEIGIMKPDRGIFDFMIQDAGIDPLETLLVDDSEKNIDMADRLGFHVYKPAAGEDWRENVDNVLHQWD